MKCTITLEGNSKFKTQEDRRTWMYFNYGTGRVR